MANAQKNIEDSIQKESTAESLEKRIIVFHNGE